MKININATTLNRPEEYTNAIITSIEAKRPFIIYSDEEHFLLTIPQYRLVMCFVEGRANTQEILANTERYIDRVKIGMVVYDKFSTVDEFYSKFPAIDNVYLLSK